MQNILKTERAGDLLGKFSNLNFEKLLNFRGRAVLGLDVGSSAVKMIQMRKENNDYVIIAAGIADIKDSSDADEKQTNIVGAIQKSLQSSGQINTGFVVCGVSGPQVAVRDFKLPPLTSDDLESAVQLEASQVCPFDINQASVDYQLISGGQDNTTGILIAATDNIIRDKLNYADLAHLNGVLVDVDGLALLNCFDEFTPECEKGWPQQVRAILNVGTSYANLAVISSDGLPFIRDIAWAGNYIIEQIAAEYQISPEIVKRALFGNEDSAFEQNQLHISLQNACRKLIRQVDRSLRYYTAGKKNVSVDRLFVCGGFALVEGFVELLNSQFSAEVMLWNPFDGVDVDMTGQSRDILLKNGPAFAVAGGLAMRSIDESGTSC